MMLDPTILPVLLGLAGLIVGSFVNLVSVRLPKGEPVLWGRSRADCCGETLSPAELIPLASWAARRGRCARCGARVSARHPAVELAGGAIGVWAAFSGATPVMALVTAAFGWQLLLIALVDADEMWLPDRLTVPLLVSGLSVAALAPGLDLLASVIGAAVGFGVLWSVAAVYRRMRERQGLGGGDPILFAAIGSWVGWMGLPTALLWACAAGLSWIGARAILRRPVSRDEPMPFGPWLAVGGWLTWLYGPVGF